MEDYSLDWLRRVSSLDEAEIRKQLIDLQDCADISKETRRNLIGLTLLSLTKDRPAVALAVAEGLSPEKNPLAGYGESLALSSLAKTDANAALAWIRRKQADDTTWDGSEARRAVLSSLAEHDPAAAVRAIAGIGSQPGDGTIEAIAGAGAKDPAQRTAVLDALRGYISTLPPDQREDMTTDALSAIATHMEREDFSATTGWLESSHLSSKEIEAFADGMDYTQTQGETGQWIEWLGKRLDAEQLSSSVGSLMSDWTQQDYQAAGKWLAAAPAGPAKEEAVASYVSEVAEYEPQVAIQWAMTLPESRRTESFQTIYDNWPESDKAGAENFARQHHLETNHEESAEAEGAAAN